MLRCQFLCHVLKTLFFIKIALKLSYFWKNMQNFQALGAPLPDPPNIPPPHCEFLTTRLNSVPTNDHAGLQFDQVSPGVFVRFKNGAISALS